MPQVVRREIDRELVDSTSISELLMSLRIVNSCRLHEGAFVMATVVEHSPADRSKNRDLLLPDQFAIDKLVAALVRIRSVDTLEGALITRHWLAADMRVTFPELDRLLKLLRWHGLVELPNEHLVTVKDHEALKAIALGAMIHDGVREAAGSAATNENNNAQEKETGAENRCAPV
jgi:hypothetical protein